MIMHSDHDDVHDDVTMTCTQVLVTATDEGAVGTWDADGLYIIGAFFAIPTTPTTVRCHSQYYWVYSGWYSG